MTMRERSGSDPRRTDKESSGSEKGKTILEGKSHGGGRATDTKRFDHRGSVAVDRYGAAS